MRKDWIYILGILILIVVALVGWQYFSKTNEVVPPTDNIPQTEVRTREISLFYYNETKDKQIGNGRAACSAESVLPVQRTIPLTTTPIQDSIRELIKGNITPAESAQGFKTEFPHEKFRLLGANLRNGVLTLEFTEVPGFTSGGSCRITLLANQIIKTAKQFAEVKEVKFKPEELFQP